MNVVTSFTLDGYKRYGKEFIETFKRYWPRHVRLTVYYEGDGIEMEPGLSWHPIEEVENLSDYMESLRFPIMHGIVGESYDINFDARMARKAFIQAHACRQYGGKVFWIDADTITHSQVPNTFLDRCLPKDKLACFLSRDGWYYTESGFIGFDADHPLASRFFKTYLHIFITGVIFTQPGWHDCYGFDAARKVVNRPELFHNLAEGLPEGTMHPFINSQLGAYMNHMKGKRKDGQPVKDGDLVVERREPYWTNVASGNTASP